VFVLEGGQTKQTARPADSLDRECEKEREKERERSRANAVEERVMWKRCVQGDGNVRSGSRDCV